MSRVRKGREFGARQYKFGYGESIIGIVVALLYNAAPSPRASVIDDPGMQVLHRFCTP